jgi:hypothetical protein
MSSRAPHHRRVAPSVHSEDQRARVEGPSEGRVPIRMQRCPVPASGSYAYVAQDDGVPLLGFLRTSAVTGALDTCGGSRLYQSRADQGLHSNDTPRSVSPSRRPGCLQPPRRARDSFLANACRRRIAPPAPSRRLSRSRHPHFFHISVEGALLGLASVTVRSPAIRDGSSSQLVREYRRLFLPPRSCLGLTTQARRVAQPTRPSTGADCPARTDAGRSA